MKKELLLHKFNNNTTGKNHIDARRIIDNDLISSVNVENDEFIIKIDGNIISENLMSTYVAKLELDKKTLEPLSTYCSCSDYEKFEFSKNNYCCKHITATFYTAIEEILRNFDFEENSNNKLIKLNEIDILSELIDTNEKEEVRLEVYINKEEWSGSLKAEFKIGSTKNRKYYVIRDIEQFLVHYYNKIPLSFGRTFNFDMNQQRFSDYDLKIIEFIEMLNEIDGPLVTLHRKDKRLVNGKYIKIPDYLIRIFFERINFNKVYLNEGFFFKPVLCEILFEKPPLDLVLILEENIYKLSYKYGLPQRLSKNEDVYLYSTNIYIPDFKFCNNAKSFFKIFEQSKSININKAQEIRVLSQLVPILKSISSDLFLSKNIKEKIIDTEAIFKFYLDKKRDVVTLNITLNYGEIEFNIFENYTKKIIYRDLDKENLVKGLIYRLGFEEKDTYYTFSKNDDYLFKLFKEDILTLQKYGEVFYSENIKSIKNIKKSDFNAQISAGKDNFFDFTFSIADIPRNEVLDIIHSLRNKVIYHKLKNGEFLDLEAIELKSFLKLIDSLLVEDNNFNGENIQCSNNKAYFISDSIDTNKLDFINGIDYLLNIKSKLLGINNLNFDVPLNLNAELRDYQKVGFNWFKTLDYLNCGGILADEMGLGKTLQTLAFILSKKNTKTLIITPTSLVYNWANEIDRFAPDLKYIVNIGDKSTREDLLSKLENVDVVITTYGLLKRDLDIYNSIYFYSIIIDEAQNIKNPKSQNALAIKSLKSNIRFALTGTPIENSVLELWSIFDFIMPLYLRTQKDFNTRYNKNLNENEEVLEELHKFINPFILRRYKKDVIKELPDKIVKEVLVPLSEQEKKIYASYSNYVSNIINKNKDLVDEQINKIEILSYITKLRQLCLDPSILLDDFQGDSSKIEALLDLLEGNISSHKILIFSQFTTALKKIGMKLNDLKINFSYLDGSVSINKRMDAIDEFNNDITNVFLISTKAGGTGLNLTSADIVIHFDPWWNPAVEDQATDRAHRFGQKNVVEVIKLIAKDTIEEKILKLQERKRSLINSVIKNDNPSNILNNLSFDEILELI